MSLPSFTPIHPLFPDISSEYDPNTWQLPPQYAKMIIERNEAEDLAKPLHRHREAKFITKIAEFKFPPKIKMPAIQSKDV